jgi:MFS family permease
VLISVSSRRKWFTVVLLALGMAIAYIDRSKLSVALAVPDFKSFFGLSDADRGTLNSVFFWTYALLQVPAGWLVDRYGVKRPYALAFLSWCLVSAAAGLAQSFGVLVALRLLLGVGEALVAPASLRWIGLHCTERERGLAIGVYMTGTKFGPALGTLLTASLITALNWRAAFLVLGLGGLIWLVFWMLVVRDDDHGDRRQASAQPAAPGTTLRQMLATRLLWGILIGTFAYNYFVFFCVTWLPVYLVERRNLSLNSMGLYTFFSFGGMATMAMLAGAVADRLIRRGGDPVRVRKAFTIAGLLLASTEVFGAYARTLPVALFFAIFSLVGLGLATANYWALTQTLIPGVALGRIAGVQNCASNLSGIAASLVTGWLKQATGGYEVPMQTMWVMLLIGLAAYIFLVKPAPLTRTSSP